MPAALWAFVLTALGLLAKESALSMPALVGPPGLLAGRRRVLGAATLGSGLAAVVYPALRLGTLLSPAESSGYALSPATAPMNFVSYVMYLPITATLEVNTLWLRSSSQLTAVALLMLGLWAGITRAWPRLGLAMLLGAALCVAPVLVLSQTATQYGYGLSLWLVACTALAWPRLGRPARAGAGAGRCWWCGTGPTCRSRCARWASGRPCPAGSVEACRAAGPGEAAAPSRVRLGVRTAHARGAVLARPADRRPRGVGGCEGGRRLRGDGGRRLVRP